MTGKEVETGSVVWENVPEGRSMLGRKTIDDLVCFLSKT